MIPIVVRKLRIICSKQKPSKHMEHKVTNSECQYQMLQGSQKRKRAAPHRLQRGAEEGSSCIGEEGKTEFFIGSHRPLDERPFRVRH
jgi:hypothetical protein